MTHQSRSGILLGLATYLWWGAVPLYFKALSQIAPSAIVAHRILWSLGLLVIVLTLWRRWPSFSAARKNAAVVKMLVASSLLISANWLIYIWAVLNGHALAASLGYYLNPLVNVLFGVVMLGERINRLQMAAVAIAAIAVSVLAWGAGSSLWISLALALTFSVYGLVRKIAPVDSVEGLSLETLLLAPFALAWLVWMELGGQRSIGIDPVTDLMIAFLGVITAVPLLMFNAAAKRLSYSVLGFLQYISPTIQLLIAVYVFGEKMTSTHVIVFVLIWTALIVFAIGGLRGSRDAQPETVPSVGI